MLFLTTLALLVSFGLCSSFRGATFAWQVTSVPIPGVHYKLRIQYRGAYSRDSLLCDASSIASGEIMGDHRGGPDVVSFLGFHCTDFSIANDWTTGTNVIDLDYWVSMYSPSGFGFLATDQMENPGWAWSSTGDLTPRLDNGLPNSSPVTAMIPVVKIQEGCCVTIDIPVADRDGDLVRCRWDAGGYVGDWCGDNCGPLSGSTLHEHSCQLSYCASQSGWFVPALQITTDVTYATPLSGIPLRFSIYVYQSTESCDFTDGPSFIDPTPVGGSHYTVMVGHSIQFDLTASNTGSASIQSIDTVSPRGMIKGPLTQESENSWSVHVNWTPNNDTMEENILCFVAINSNSLTSRERCITIAVVDQIAGH